MTVSATYRVEAKLSDTVDQFFDEEIADFDAVTPAWDGEADFEEGDLTDFDVVTDAGGKLSASTSAKHDGVYGLACVYNVANQVSLGKLNLTAVDQSSAFTSFWFDPNSVACGNSVGFILVKFANGADVAINAGIIKNNGANYDIRWDYRNDAGNQILGTTIITDAPHKISLYSKISSAPGANDGVMLVYIDDVLELSKLDIDNDTFDIDGGQFGCVYAYANAAQAGTFYMDTIYIDTVGALMVDMLAAKNGTYGLSVPVMDTTARYGSFTNPDSETVLMTECWFDPNTITMAANDEYVFMWAEGNKFAISVNYSGGYRIRASATKDAGSEETAYYSITDAPHHIRGYWGAATGMGENDGYLYLYIDHILQEALTGLDNDTVSVGNIYVGNTGVDAGTYGIFYLDDCKWGPWIDITSDVIGDIVGGWGMVDNEPLDLLADTGAMRIILDNESGKYLPGLANALDGFKKGTPVRLRFNYSSLDYIRFYGTIDTLEPEPGAYIVDKVTIEVTDWMDYAATHPLLAPSLGTDQRADEMITTLVADMPIAPLATDYDTGVNTFPTSFDNVTTKTRAYTELNKINLSELGYCYLQKDPVYGETLVFESAEYRNGLRTPDFTSDNTMTSLEVEYGENVINRFINKVYPRRVDAAPVVLFETEARQRIPSGQTIVFRGNYTDPDGGGTEVSGKDMITPVITTDYTAMGNRDGTGGNYTADLTVGVDKGTEGTTFTLTNGAGTTVWVWIRIRGYGIYFYNPIENAAEDSTSYDEFGYKSIILNQKYMDDLGKGALAGAAIIEQEKQPRTKLNKVSFVANRTDALMLAWLTWDVGNMCYLKNTDYNIDEYAYIQGVAFTISPGGLVIFTWIVKGMLSLLLGLSLISAEFDSGTTDAINYGFLPHVFSDDTGDYSSMSAWIYMTVLPVAPSYRIAGFNTNAGGYRFRVRPGASSGKLAIYSNLFDIAPGDWTTDDVVVGVDAWYNVIVTYDVSVPANDPIIYVGGVLKPITEFGTPAGAAFSRDGNLFMIGNVLTPTENYTRPFDGLIKDVRVYDVILTQAEATSLAAGGNVTRGMVFQGPCVRTKELDYFEDRTLTAVDRLIDNMYGCVGTPNNTVITRLIP